MTTELQAKHEQVQYQLNDLMNKNYNRSKLKLEIEAVLQGYANYLEQQGFGGIEIPMIIEQLSFNRFWLN